MLIDAMYWTCADVLAIGARLSAARDLPAVDVLQRRIQTLLAEMEKKGIELGLSKADIDEARYPIIAFLDEQIFRSPWEGRQDWMLSPLQLVYFNENTAGEGFFTRLTALERDPSRAHILEVYYLCLALGFQGQYAVRGGDGLVPLMERLQQALSRAAGGGDVISPHGLPKRNGTTLVRAEAPFIALGVGTLGLALLIFVILKISLAVTASDASSSIQKTATALQSSASRGAAPAR